MESESIDIWHTIEFRGLAVPSLQLKHLRNVDYCHESCIKVEGAGIFCTRYSSTCQSRSHCEGLRGSRMSYEHSDNCDNYVAAMCKARTYFFDFLQRSILEFSHSQINEFNGKKCSSGQHDCSSTCEMTPHYQVTWQLWMPAPMSGLFFTLRWQGGLRFPWSIGMMQGKQNDMRECVWSLKG